MDDKATVVQVVVGWSEEASQGWWQASGSVSLVRHSSVTCLVDCGSPWDGESLIAKLGECGISADDVTHVVCTHGHIDHVGNLNLFPKAEMIMDCDLGKPNGLYKTIDWAEPVALSPKIEIIRTPGHTAHDLSVIVKTEDLGNVGISGDIFESERDDSVWKDNSWNIDIQQKSRQRLLEISDWIVPGHGNIFEVKNQA